jgi:hypothetical protein
MKNEPPTDEVLYPMCKAVGVQVKPLSIAQANRSRPCRDKYSWDLAAATLLRGFTTADHSSWDLSRLCIQCDA